MRNKIGCSEMKETTMNEKHNEDLFLSIIIPVYNCEKYILDCLDSCIEQDIPKDNYEIIGIDDGSEDNSAIILDEYSRKYNNIKYYSQVNCGVSAARNYGVKKAQGKYILFLDADDFLADNCLNEFKKILEKASINTMVCLGRYHFTEQGYSDRHLNKGEYMGCKPTTGYITNRIIPYYYASHLRFQENVLYGEDEVYNFELRLLELETILLDKPIYFYRIHEDSACGMTPDKRIKRLESQINSVIYLRETYDLNQDKVLWFYNHRIKMTLDLIVYVRFKEKIKYLKKLKDLDLLSPYTNSNRVPKNLLFLYIYYFVIVNKKRVVRKINGIVSKNTL